MPSPETVRVVIATSQGPVEIEAIIDLDPGDPSIVGLGSSARLITGFSTPYADFVAKGSGIIARHFGHDAFRLELSRDINEGDSWQLGVFIAHALHEQGRLAEAGQPASTVVWATGMVDYRLRVGRIGLLAEKLSELLVWLERGGGAGSAVAAIWPGGNAGDVSASVLARLKASGVTITEAQDARTVLAALGLDPIAEKLLPKLRTASPWPGVAALLVAFAVEMLIVVALGPIAPPWPPGMMIGTTAVVALTLAGTSPMVRHGRTIAGNSPRLSIVVMSALFALYVHSASVFEYTAHGVVFVRGFACTADAETVFRDRDPSCPWLSDEQLSLGEFKPETFWTASSIAVVRTGLATLWLAMVLVLSVLVGEVSRAWMTLSRDGERPEPAD